jgi:hypothetical protein
MKALARKESLLTIAPEKSTVTVSVIGVFLSLARPGAFLLGGSNGQLQKYS